MADETKAKAKSRDLELELLQEKLKNLESKITKPQTSEEAYQLRQQQYDAKAPEREALKNQIELNRMKIQNQYPRAKHDEVIKLEAWTRRALEVEKTNPDYAQKIRAQIKLTLKEINSDPFR